jgi:hypothetical protein
MLNQISCVKDQSEEEFILYQELNALNQAINQAKVSYSFFKGRKFELLINSKVELLSYNEILAKIEVLTRKDKFFSGVEKNSDQFNFAFFKSYRIYLNKFKETTELVTNLNNNAEKELQARKNAGTLSYSELLKFYVLNCIRAVTNSGSQRLKSVKSLKWYSKYSQMNFEIQVFKQISQLKMKKFPLELECIRLECELKYFPISHREKKIAKEDILVLDQEGQLHGNVAEIFKDSLEEIEAYQQAHKISRVSLLNDLLSTNLKIQAILKKIIDFADLVIDSKEKLIPKIENEFLEELEKLPSNKKLDAIVELITDARDKNDLKIVFGLEEGYDKDALRKARLVLQRKLHPDKNKGCEKKAKELFIFISSIADYLSIDE